MPNTGVTQIYSALNIQQCRVLDSYMADAWRHYYPARSVTCCYSLASYPGAPVRGNEPGYEATYSWGLI